MPEQYSMFPIPGYKPESARPVTPRDWQSRFAEKVLSKFQTGERNFLCESVPAGGKTFGSLRVAQLMFEQRIVEQLIVVAPTDYLRDQWIRKAWEMAGFALKEIQVDPRTGRMLLTDEYCGVVTTYAQISTNVDRLFAFGRAKQTLVIFDEIHHCGEEKNWGSGVMSAFWKDGADKLFYRLSISGTPFRTDNDRMPFVDYEKKYIDKPDGTLDVQWVSRPDFTYTYLDALMDDDVVREVTFRMEKGKFSWKSNVGDFAGQQLTNIDFVDELDEALWNERYKTAVNPLGDYVREILIKANDELTLYRTEKRHPNAAGLVLVEDKKAAEIIGEVLYKIVGEKPIVVHDEVPDARGMIEQFSTSDPKNPGESKRWIVSIRMVSEGVDIPRLRIAVYLSRFKTQLFFLQFIGRVTRWVKELPLTDPDGRPLGQPATVYIPADPELMTYARELQDAVEHYIKLRMERTAVGVLGNPLPSEYEWINATEADEAAEGHHAAGGYAEVTPDEYPEIDRFKDRFQILRHAPRAGVKGMMQYLRQADGQQPSQTSSDQNKEDIHLAAVLTMVDRDQKNTEDGWGMQPKAPAKENKDLRKAVQTMVNRLALRLVKAELSRGSILAPLTMARLSDSGIRLEIDENGKMPQALAAEMAKSIHAALKRVQGVDAKNAKNDQLEERRKILADWEAELLSDKLPQITYLTFTPRR